MRYLFITLLLFPVCAFPQITLSSLGLNFGMSRFEAIAVLNGNSNIYGIKPLGPYEDYVAYLSMSVHKSSLNFKYHATYYEGYETSVDLLFAEDRLFRVVVSVYYHQQDLSKCLNDYSFMRGKVKLEYPIENDSRLTILDGANEKTGEGWTYFKSEREKNLSYELYAKKAYAEVSYRMLIGTNEIYGYEMDTEYLDLVNTPFTSQGY